MMRVLSTILLVSLIVASGCKLTSSLRGKHKSHSSEDASGSEAPAASPGAENPTISDQGTASTTINNGRGPTKSEDEFKVPDPTPETPTEGVVNRPSTGGIEVSGDVSGIWDKTMTPVRVVGEITLRTGKTLAIKEGVQVIFNSGIRFLVEGAQLKIGGTAAEPVTFTSAAADQTWGGIRVCGNTDCKKEGVLGHLDIRFAIFENARKDDLGEDVTWRRGGVFNIRTTETVLIEDSIFRNNFGLERAGAVEIIAENPNIIFRRNTLKDNNNQDGGGALQITNGRNLRLESNIFTGNKSTGAASEGGAIAFIDSAAIDLISNTFENNSAVTGGAIYCDGHGTTISIDSSNVFKANKPVDTVCKDSAPAAPVAAP